MVTASDSMKIYEKLSTNYKAFINSNVKHNEARPDNKIKKAFLELEELIVKKQKKRDQRQRAKNLRLGKKRKTPKLLSKRSIDRTKNCKSMRLKKMLKPKNKNRSLIGVDDGEYKSSVYHKGSNKPQSLLINNKDLTENLEFSTLTLKNHNDTIPNMISTSTFFGEIDSIVNKEQNLVTSKTQTLTSFRSNKINLNSLKVPQEFQSVFNSRFSKNGEVQSNLNLFSKQRTKSSRAFNEEKQSFKKKKSFFKNKNSKFISIPNQASETPKNKQKDIRSLSNVNKEKVTENKSPFFKHSRTKTSTKSTKALLSSTKKPTNEKVYKTYKPRELSALPSNTKQINQEFRMKKSTSTTPKTFYVQQPIKINGKVSVTNYGNKHLKVVHPMNRKMASPSFNTNNTLHQGYPSNPRHVYFSKTFNQIEINSKSKVMLTERRTANDFRPLKTNQEQRHLPNSQNKIMFSIEKKESFGMLPKNIPNVKTKYSNYNAFNPSTFTSVSQTTPNFRINSMEKPKVKAKFLSKMDNNVNPKTIASSSSQTNLNIPLIKSNKGQNNQKNINPRYDFEQPNQFEHKAGNVKKSRSISKFLKGDKQDNQKQKKFFFLESKYKSPIKEQKSGKNRFVSSNLRSGGQRSQHEHKFLRPKLYAKQGKQIDRRMNQLLGQGPPNPLHKSGKQLKSGRAVDINNISKNIARFNLNRNQIGLKSFHSKFNAKVQPNNYSQKTFNFNNL